MKKIKYFLLYAVCMFPLTELYAQTDKEKEVEQSLAMMTSDQIVESFISFIQTQVTPQEATALIKKKVVYKQLLNTAPKNVKMTFIIADSVEKADPVMQGKSYHLVFSELHTEHNKYKRFIALDADLSNILKNTKNLQAQKAIQRFQRYVAIMQCIETMEEGRTYVVILTGSSASGVISFVHRKNTNPKKNIFIHNTTGINVPIFAKI